MSRATWALRWWNNSAGGTDASYQRDGAQALRATILPGDARMYGRSGQATERSELLQRARYRLGEPVWYRFSILVPDRFPVADVRLVTAQWKQATVRSDLKRSPVVAQRLRDGRLSVTIDTDEGQRELYAAGNRASPALVGGWTDFVYRIRFARDESGELDVWIAGEHVVSYRGLLGYRDDLGSTRFRVGLYRDAMAEPMTVYYDAVSIVVE